jgi:ABC-2 type transport system ATP-binding protein
MSSHNLFEVENICTSIAIIKKGKVVALEDIKTLHDKKMHIVEMELDVQSNHGKKFDMKIFNDPLFEIVEDAYPRLKLKVSGDINRFLDLLAKIKVRDLLITHASLEEIFLEYYEN